MSDQSSKKDVLGKSISTIWNELTKDEGEEHVVSVELAVKDISPNPEQPRKFFDTTALDELKASIRQEGVLQPILVRRVEDATYQIVAGERRWKACSEIGLEHIPAIILECDSVTAIQLGLIENLQRDALSPIDEARSLQMLMQKYNKNAEEIARILSKSISFVRNSLRLLKLPESVQELLANQKISAGHARAIVEVEDPEEVAKKIIRDKLSVRDVENLVREQKRPSRPFQEGKIDNSESQVLADTAMFEELLSEYFCVPTRIRLKGEGGSIQIYFKDAQQLEEIFDKISR